MSESLLTDSYKGVRDFYPADWARMEAVFARIRKTLVLWGYEEYNSSPLERAELYEAKTSEEIVSEQTYTFIDRGDRKVTLRPEMTPTLARMVAAKRRELSLPLRWFSIPNVFRYERPQRGRLREHYQLNVDLVGLPEGQADLETISVAAAILKAFGARDDDFAIHISDRALLFEACTAAGITGERQKTYMRLLDKKDKMSTQEFADSLGKISDNDPLDIIKKSRDGIVAEMKDRMQTRIKQLNQMNVLNVTFDPTITRGFDYYTGMVFEVFDTNPENARALFGGGRYDGLVALFGGDSIPAVGFGMGDVTLTDFLETHGLLPKAGHAPTLFLGTPPTHGTSLMVSQLALEGVAASLRSHGISVFVNLSTKSLSDQIKDAVKRGIPFFIAYGANEVTKGTVHVKVLATGEEVEVPFTELAARLIASN